MDMLDVLFVVFFKQKTAYEMRISDWSSDVCSSDLGDRHGVEACVYEPLRPIGGSISAEHGIGLEKKPWLDVSRSAAERGLMAELKQLLDPGHILNPGKVLDVHP